MSYATKIDTSIKKDLSKDLPTKMQVLLANDIAEYYGLQDVLSNIGYNKAEYSMFLNLWSKKYKAELKKGSINVSLY